jgi:hypothetical protein
MQSAGIGNRRVSMPVPAVASSAGVTHAVAKFHHFNRRVASRAMAKNCRTARVRVLLSLNVAISRWPR